MNENLEVKKIISDSSIHGCYELENGNIMIINLKEYRIKLFDKNFVLIRTIENNHISCDLIELKSRKIVIYKDIYIIVLNRDGDIIYEITLDFPVRYLFETKDGDLITFSNDSIHLINFNRL